MVIFLWILTVLLIFAAIVFVIWLLIYYFCEYRGNIVSHGPKLKLKTFLIFYDINPDRWILHSWRVTCKVPPAHNWNRYDEEDFHFGYIDTWRYYLWYTRLKNTKEAKEQDEATLRMLEAVKSDVAKMQNKAQMEINEAEDILKKGNV